MAGTRTAPGAVVRHQVEAVQGRAEARVVPGALVLRLAGAAATRGRIVARPVVPGRVEPRPAEAATVLVVVIVVQEKAAPRADLAAVVPLLAVPVVPALAGAAARPGVTRMELVVATPAAVAVQIGPYLVEEVAGALCARQRPEAQACLVKKAVAVQFAP